MAMSASSDARLSAYAGNYCIDAYTVRRSVGGNVHLKRHSTTVRTLCGLCIGGVYPSVPHDTLRNPEWEYTCPAGTVDARDVVTCSVCLGFITPNPAD